MSLPLSPRDTGDRDELTWISLTPPCAHYAQAGRLNVARRVFGTSFFGTQAQGWMGVCRVGGPFNSMVV